MSSLLVMDESKQNLLSWKHIIPHKELNEILSKIKEPISPTKDKIFKAFELCNYNNLKCIILGMDPYTDPKLATGLAFANPAAALSPSLLRVRDAALGEELKCHFDPTLEEWAKQGVLLLNSALTTKVGESKAHLMLWRPFIAKFLNNLSEVSPGLIYILLGEVAQTFTPYIGINNYILTEKHPAYYARVEENMPSTVFIQTNNLLKQLNNLTIDWSKH